MLEIVEPKEIRHFLKRRILGSYLGDKTDIHTAHKQHYMFQEV